MGSKRLFVPQVGIFLLLYSIPAGCRPAPLCPAALGVWWSRCQQPQVLSNPLWIYITGSFPRCGAENGLSKIRMTASQIHRSQNPQAIEGRWKDTLVMCSAFQFNQKPLPSSSKFLSCSHIYNALWSFSFRICFVFIWVQLPDSFMKTPSTPVSEL